MLVNLDLVGPQSLIGIRGTVRDMGRREKCFV